MILDCNRQLAGKLAELQKHVDATEQERSETGKQLETVAAQLHETEASLASVAHERAEHPRAMNDELAEARAERDRARAEIERVNAELESARAQLVAQRKDAQRYFETLGAEQESFRREGRKVKERIAATERAVSLLKAERDAIEAARGELENQLADANLETERLGRERDAAIAQHFALTAERDALKAEMTAMIEQQQTTRDLAAKLAAAEHRVAELAANLEQAKAFERELRDALAEAPRLAKLLSKGIQETAPPIVASTAPPPAAIPAGTFAELISRMRHALERSSHSLAEGLAELGALVEGLSARAAAAPERRAVHRFSSILGIFVSDTRIASRAAPSALLAIRRAIDVLEQLLRTDNPSLPAASVIVVDRDRAAVQAVIAAMKSIEFQLFCAEESRPALETLAAEHHDLILLNWQGSASIQDAHYIRAMPRHQRTPILFLVDEGNEEAAALIADEVLIKPLSAPEVALKSLTLVFKAQLT